MYHAGPGTQGFGAARGSYPNGSPPYPTNFFYPHELVMDDELSPQRNRHSAEQRRYSSASSIGSPSPSVFSHPSSASTYSTAPSLRGPTRDRRPPVPTPQPLRCEFIPHGLCDDDVVFDVDDVEEWISHVVSIHLGGRLPSAAGCCFCRIEPFRSDMNVGGAEESFRARMYHMADHFRFGLTHVNMNFDPYVLGHLYFNGLISREDVDRIGVAPTMPSEAGLYPANWRHSTDEQGDVYIESSSHRDRRSRTSARSHRRHH